jgi:hypothetical protein
MTAEMIWMDRILYYEDGHKETQRQFVPKTWCKHDDGKCHPEDPCEDCPQRTLQIGGGKQ